MIEISLIPLFPLAGTLLLPLPCEYLHTVTMSLFSLDVKATDMFYIHGIICLQYIWVGLTASWATTVWLLFCER